MPREFLLCFLCLVGRKQTVQELLADLTGAGEEVFDGQAKGFGWGILGLGRQQVQLLSQLFGFAGKMSQTGLAVLGMGAVVSGVSVGDQDRKQPAQADLSVPSEFFQ